MFNPWLVGVYSFWKSQGLKGLGTSCNVEDPLVRTKHHSFGVGSLLEKVSKEEGWDPTNCSRDSNVEWWVVVFMDKYK